MQTQAQNTQPQARIEFQVPALQRNENGTPVSEAKSQPSLEAQAQAQTKRAEQFVLLTKYYEELQQLVQQARNDGLFLSKSKAETEPKSEAVDEEDAVAGTGESESESEGIEKSAWEAELNLWVWGQLKRREFLTHLQARQAEFSKILTPLEEALKQLGELIYKIESSFSLGIISDIWIKNGFKFDTFDTEAKRQEKEKEAEAKLKLKNMQSENAQYVSDALNLRWMAYQASHAPFMLKHLGVVYSVKPLPVDVSALPMEMARFINSVNAMSDRDKNTNTNPTDKMAADTAAITNTESGQGSQKFSGRPRGRPLRSYKHESKSKGEAGMKVEATNSNLNLPQLEAQPELELELAGGNAEPQPQPQPHFGANGANKDKEWWQYYGIEAGFDHAHVSESSDSSSSTTRSSNNTIPFFGLSGEELQYSPRPTLCIGRPGAGGVYDLENCALADMRRSDTENIGRGNSPYSWNSVVLVDSSGSGERIDDILDRLPATHDKLTCLVDPTDTERVTSLSLDDIARLIDKGANIFYRLSSGAGAGAGKTQQQELRADILRDLLRVFRMRSYNQPAAKLRRLVSVYFDEWEWLTPTPGFNFEALKTTFAQICEGGGLPLIVTKDAAGAAEFLSEVYSNSNPALAPNATANATTATAEDVRTTKGAYYNYNLIVKALPANPNLRGYYAKLLARLGVDRDNKECTGSSRDNKAKDKDKGKENWSFEAILSKFSALPPFGGVGYFPSASASASASVSTTPPEKQEQEQACNLVLLRTLYQELSPSRAETEPEVVEEEPPQLIEELTRYLWHRGKLKWVINPSRNKTEFQLAGHKLDAYTSTPSVIRHLQRWLIELESIPLENWQRQKKFEELSEAEWQLYRAARYGRDQALTNYILANPDIVGNFRQRVIMLSRLQWGVPIAEARAKERR